MLPPDIVLNGCNYCDPAAGGAAELHLQPSAGAGAGHAHCSIRRQCKLGLMKAESDRAPASPPSSAASFRPSCSGWSTA